MSSGPCLPYKEQPPSFGSANFSPSCFKGEEVSVVSTSIDLKGAYFHIPILKSARKFLQFTFNGKVYQFRVMPFCLTTAPLVFTKMLLVVISFLHRRGIDISISISTILFSFNFQK